MPPPLEVANLIQGCSSCGIGFVGCLACGLVSGDNVHVTAIHRLEQSRIGNSAFVDVCFNANETVRSHQRTSGFVKDNRSVAVVIQTDIIPALALLADGVLLCRGNLDINRRTKCPEQLDSGCTIEVILVRRSVNVAVELKVECPGGRRNRVVPVDLG